MTGTTLLKGIPPTWAKRKDAPMFLEMALMAELRRIRGSSYLGKSVKRKGFILSMQDGQKFRITVTHARKEW